MRAILSVAAVLVGAVLVGAAEEKVPLDKLPEVVKKAVKKRFPKLKISGASREKDGDKLVFEVSLKKAGKNIDVTVTEDGAITLIEREIAFNDLPKAVARTFRKKYPKAKCKIIETVTKVAGGKETLKYYEATLTPAGGKEQEVKVLPDGKIKPAEAKCGK
jgi:hypothetical protein